MWGVLKAVEVTVLLVTDFVFAADGSKWVVQESAGGIYFEEVYGFNMGTQAVDADESLSAKEKPVACSRVAVRPCVVHRRATAAKLVR